MIPCDKCITKVICLNKKEIKCNRLTKFLEYHLQKYPKVRSRDLCSGIIEHASYRIPKFGLTVHINLDIVTIRHTISGVVDIYAPFGDSRIEFRHLYDILQKINNKSVIKKESNG
jgi:hypothetical protein